ncbi:MAG: hypothetical protein SF123_23195 [Chloroflexota bacterium]|nr:hypothetical protein [Chloroflexota bacterium]
MRYEIHLYVPKTGYLTPAMMEWMFQYGQEAGKPEWHWPVRKLNPRALARLMLKLDPTLIPLPGRGTDVELRFAMPQVDLSLYVHDRGAIIFFPYTADTLLRVVLGITYTYIRYLYDAAGFWSYDPQLNVLSYADDFNSIDETAALMEALLPKMIES